MSTPQNEIELELQKLQMLLRGTLYTTADKIKLLVYVLRDENYWQSRDQNNSTRELRALLDSFPDEAYLDRTVIWKTRTQSLETGFKRFLRQCREIATRQRASARATQNLYEALMSFYDPEYPNRDPDFNAQFEAVVLDYVRMHPELINSDDPNSPIKKLTPFQQGIAYIEARDWKSLSALIESHPEVLLTVSKLRMQECEPTILFRIIPSAEDSPACVELLQTILRKSPSILTAEECDERFGNTAFTYACAMGSPTIIRVMREYYQHENPVLLTMANSVHDDARNTPLLLAIKNGDIETALAILPYYQEDDLLVQTRAGNTALHLACYLRLEPVIEKLLARARELGCLETVITQRRNNPHQTPATPAELYSAAQEFEKNPPWWDEVGKFKFAHDVHEGRKARSAENPDILRELRPSSIHSETVNDNAPIPLKNLNDYYKYGAGNERFHFFAVKRSTNSPETGDSLKRGILENFRTQLTGLSTLEQLEEFISTTKQGEDYKVLATSQGIFTRMFHWAGIKTDSEKAFEEMCEDARTYLQTNIHGHG